MILQLPSGAFNRDLFFMRVCISVFTPPAPRRIPAPFVRVSFRTANSCLHDNTHCHTAVGDKLPFSLLNWLSLFLALIFCPSEVCHQNLTRRSLGNFQLLLKYYGSWKKCDGESGTPTAPKGVSVIPSHFITNETVVQVHRCHEARTSLHYVACATRTNSWINDGGVQCTVSGGC